MNRHTTFREILGPSIVVFRLPTPVESTTVDACPDMATRLLRCLASSLHSKQSIAGDVLTKIRPFPLAKAEVEAFVIPSFLYVTGRIRASHGRVSLSRPAMLAEVVRL